MRTRNAHSGRRTGLLEQPDSHTNRTDGIRDLYRWLRRRRTIHAPRYTAATITTVALYAHAQINPAWTLLGTICITLWLIAYAGHTLDRTIERRYAVAIITAAALWADTVALAGMSAHLAWTGIAVTAAADIPWRRHRRIRARSRTVRVEHRLPYAIARNAPGVAVRSVTHTPHGLVTRLRLDGTAETVSTLQRKGPSLARDLNIPAGGITVEPVAATAADAIAHITVTDPLAAPIPWPGPTVDTIRRPFPIGLYADGSLILLNLRETHVLIGGPTGDGKTVLLNVIAASVAAMPDADLWIVDVGKDGAAALPWAPSAGRIATTLGEARALLAEAVEWQRYRSAEGAGRRSKVNPTADEPQIVVAIDDAAKVLEDPVCLAFVIDLSELARAAAISLVLLAQKTTLEVLGSGRLKTNLRTRILLPVNEPQDAREILPDDWKDVPLSALDAPGKILVRQGSVRPVVGRGYLLDDIGTVRGIAEQWAPHRPEIPRPVVPDDNTPEGSADMLTGTLDVEEPAPADDDSRAVGLWKALEDAGVGGIRVKAMMGSSGIPRSTLHDLLARWVKAGYVERIGHGIYARTVHGK